MSTTINTTLNTDLYNVQQDIQAGNTAKAKTDLAQMAQDTKDAMQSGQLTSATAQPLINFINNTFLPDESNNPSMATQDLQQLAGVVDSLAGTQGASGGTSPGSNPAGTQVMPLTSSQLASAPPGVELGSMQGQVIYKDSSGDYFGVHGSTVTPYDASGNPEQSTTVAPNGTFDSGGLSFKADGAGTINVVAAGSAAPTPVSPVSETDLSGAPPSIGLAALQGHAIYKDSAGNYCALHNNQVTTYSSDGTPSTQTVPNNGSIQVGNLTFTADGSGNVTVTGT